MVRILLILAILGGIITGVFGFLTNGKKKEAELAREQAETSLSTTKTELTKTSKDLKTVQVSLTDANGKITDLTTKNQGIQAQLKDAQSKAADLETRASAAEEKANAAQAKLSDTEKQVGAEKAAVAEAKKKADDLEKKRREVEDQLQKANAEASRLKDVMERSKTGTLPPGIMGKIVSVNRNWNFVVLNIGEKDGLVENGELIVSRNKQVIGRVRIVSTEANTAVADIEVNTLQGQIETGDDVLD
ncbi:MAG: hypothetical protein PW734_07540 [Verrucomicrobium sp.]|nr:hypothetical protein [Verrucomicrobium sp.]